MGLNGHEKKKGSRISNNEVNPTVKFGGSNIMFRGCMTSKGVGFVHHIEGRMTAASYVNILENN